MANTFRKIISRVLPSRFEANAMAQAPSDERARLLGEIAATIRDYRLGEIPPLDSKHVDRWISQFADVVQVPMMRELNHVLRQTYFSREALRAFLADQLDSVQIAGKRPQDFWKNANFLRIQIDGKSQVELLDLLDEVMEQKWGFKTEDCGKPGGPFVYLDDIMFTGSRVQGDLTAWLEQECPRDATLHIIVLARHTSCYYAQGRIEAAAMRNDRRLTMHVWRAKEYENRKKYRDESDVLWPVEIPDDSAISAYLDDSKYPFEPRNPGSNSMVFSSEEGRQLLEREFLSAGFRILSACEKPATGLRPLGFGAFGFGFGTMLVTYRNCPNNAPLALWWGLQGWHPLFPRKPYHRGFDFD